MREDCATVSCTFRLFSCFCVLREARKTAVSVLLILERAIIIMQAPFLSAFQTFYIETVGSRQDKAAEACPSVHAIRSRVLRLNCCHEPLSSWSLVSWRFPTPFFLYRRGNKQITTTFFSLSQFSQPWRGLAVGSAELGRTSIFYFADVFCGNLVSCIQCDHFISVVSSGQKALSFVLPPI